MEYDVLVVGAGPAGATAAYVLAREGAKVLVVDIKRRPGVPVQCAEFVPIQLRHKFPEFFPEEVVAQPVKDMVHFTPWGEVVSMYSEGYVLHRDRFDRLIVELALEGGAELRLRTQFLGFEDGKLWLEHIDTRERYPLKAGVVIGADGPRSRTARLTGEHTTSFLATAQFTMPLKVRVKDLLIYFRDYIPGGYGWVFPKGEFANVGVGIDPYYPVNVMHSLRKFVEEVVAEGVVQDKVVGRTGGWIPAEGVKRPLRGKVLLVGDAGGFCHPITGGGIANAVYTGAMAGEAVLAGDLEEYEEEAMELFGSTLNRAAHKRIKYMKSWDNLKSIIPRTWIAFEEYWKEE
ncbi:geranylgeranyl reductase family protein [Hydrogenivirga sp.]